MTIVYFIRHAEPNYNNHDDKLRELTSKGLKDRELVTQYLISKNIDVALSSPYKRSIDTIQHFTDIANIPIEIIDNFKERKIDNVWIDDYNSFSIHQWEDFNYKLSNGESLQEVQDRNISALESALKKYKDKNIIVGSHGTALSTIINYYDKSFNYEDFNNIRFLMPWIVKFTFNNLRCISIEKINVFQETL